MKKINSILINITKFTEDVSEFIFKLEDKIDFIPWQFLMMNINNWDIKTVKRAYSVVSYDSKNDILILCIKNINWIWTKWIFSLNIWDKVEFTWPFWHFFVKNEKNNLFFFATWIWLPPILCLLEDIFNKWVKKNIKLFFWLRNNNEIYYKNSIDKLVEKNWNFSYEICLSRENIEWFYNWYITKRIFDENIDWKDVECYYCWSVDIARDLRLKLNELWVENKYFSSEAF